ncbi:MAG: ABC transporter permease [Clostridium sp.]
MKQLVTILKFEFMNIVSKKVFIITTVGIALIIGILLSIPRFGFFDSTPQSKGVKTIEDSKKSVIALVDKTNKAEDTLKFLSSRVSEYKFVIKNLDEVSLKSEVKDEKYFAGLIIESENKAKYIVNDPGIGNKSNHALESALDEKYKVDQLEKYNIKHTDIEKILHSNVKVETIQIGEDKMGNYFYTYIMIFALYMAILLYGQLVATSVASEKSSRAMEMLITSAKPSNLIFGKVIGSGLAGLLQLSVMFGSGFVFYNINKGFWGDNHMVESVFDMPFNIVVFALIFFLLGYFIYSFIYGAIGSLASRTEDINSSTMPVTLIFIVAFFIVISAMGSGNLDSTMMVIASYIPFTSPMAMFARITMGNVGPIEITISIAILIGSTILIGYIASIVYKKGVLIYGKTFKFKDMVKLIKK